LFSRVYVGDVARAVLAALQGRGVSGCFNVVEAKTAPMRLFYEQVVAATGTELELVRVPDSTLPADLRAAGAVEQHLLASPNKIREVLDWRDTGTEHFAIGALAHGQCAQQLEPGFLG